MSWHPEDPRSWGGWAPWDPRWGPHRAGWGSHRPLHDNQLGWRLPTGGPPSPGQTGLGIALLLFVLGPATILAWMAGQALLRATGLRWWKLALAAVATIAVVVAIQGGPGPALAHHFAGYLWLVQQFGRPVIHLPTPGAFLWPQLPLSVPVGLLAAALNLAGRRQAIDPAEVRKTQREARKRMSTAVKRAERLRDDPAGPVALGVRIDGDLGWADRRGLVVVPPSMQGRSRLIAGTSGSGKTTDIEREALIAARAGRKFFLVDGKGTDPGLGRVSRIASGPVGSGAQPDKDVRDTHRGLVADGELVEAGRHRAELLAPVHQPLHPIAQLVPVPVEGRRPATPSPLARPVGLLVIPLGDRVPDVAGPQRRPVGPAAVGLVPGQVHHPRAGPAPATGTGHPHGVDQPDQLAGVGVLARGQPGGQVAAPPIADGVQLGGQPAA
jgi:hypothetical protein